MIRWKNKTMDSRHRASLQKRARFISSLLVLFLLSLSIAPAVSAAPTAAQLEAKYVKTLAKLVPESRNGVSYLLIDMDKDGLSECLVDYQNTPGGSGSIFALYDYTSGKVKRRLFLSQYGLEKVTYYPATKSLVLYGNGHGGEWYRYFKKSSKGTYKLKATRGRAAIAGGSMSNGPFSYSDKNGKITKSAFKKIIKKLQKGSKKTYKLYGDSAKWSALRK